MILSVIELVSDSNFETFRIDRKKRDEKLFVNVTKGREKPKMFARKRSQAIMS